MSNHDKLWVHILSHKYLNHGSLLQGTARSDDSFTWKSILHAYSVLKDSFRFRVGNGDLSFWYDKWLDVGRLCDKVVFVNIQDVDMKVSDVFYDRTWHLQKLATWLPETVIRHILATHVVRDVVLDDVLIWPFSATGNFTSKSTAYSWLASQSFGQHAHLVGFGGFGLLKRPISWFG